MSVDLMAALFAPAALACLGGLGAFAGLVISKESKVSEFRQAWIDALRQELANHVAATLALARHIDHHEGFQQYRAANGAPPDAQLNWLRERTGLESTVTSTRSAIRLRINRSEKKAEAAARNARLLDVLSAIEAAFRADDFKTARVRIAEVDDIAPDVLKAEWIRVKRGEPFFRAMKWICCGIFAVAVVLVSTVSLGVLG